MLKTLKLPAGGEVGVAVLVVAIIALMILPLPPEVLDVLLSINLCLNAPLMVIGLPDGIDTNTRMSRNEIRPRKPTSPPRGCIAPASFQTAVLRKNTSARRRMPRPGARRVGSSPVRDD